MPSKSNKRLAADTTKSCISHGNTKSLNAATRNPTTPAGTYPAFESHLGGTALEKKHEHKQAKQHKWATRKESISLLLKTVVPVFLVAGVLLGGIMLFSPSTCDTPPSRHGNPRINSKADPNKNIYRLYSEMVFYHSHGNPIQGQ